MPVYSLENILACKNNPSDQIVDKIAIKAETSVEAISFAKIYECFDTERHVLSSSIITTAGSLIWLQKFHRS